MTEKRETGVFCIDAIKALSEANATIGEIFLQRIARLGEVKGDLRVLVESREGLAKTAHNICPLPDPLISCPMLNGEPCRIPENVVRAEIEDIYV